MARANIALIEELLEDDLDINVVVAAVENLAEPVNIVPPEREAPVRNTDFFELTIPQYNLDDFQSHFRMTRNTFQEIVNRLHINRQHHDVVPFDKKVLFSIWMLAQPESFRAAGDRFNMAKSTSNLIFLEIVELICSIRHEEIVWPNEGQRNIIKRELEEKSSIPGIVGIIDGTHIPIKAPPHNANDYYNRNNVHSVILQAICDNKKQFIDIFVGTPGKVHDGRVFRISPIFNLLSNGPPTISENEHIIGDNAYALSAFLLKPFRDNGHLTRQQIRFNTLLSSVRARIEQAFGLLKGKFRRLKYLEMIRIDKVPSVITAACVLHNLIIKFENPVFAEEEIENINEDEDIFNDELHPNVNNEGERKRDFITNLL